MKIFLDSANIDEIKIGNDLGVISGITTNPILIAKNNVKKEDLIYNIRKITNIPVSLQITNIELVDDIVKEGLRLSKLAENIVIKMAITINNLKACQILTSEYNIQTNITACCAAVQAIVIAKSDATFISPFIGRLEDASEDGIALIKSIKTIYDNNLDIKTQIIAASIRNVLHVQKIAEIGVDIATMSLKLIEELYYNKITNNLINAFNQCNQENLIIDSK